ncbi:MAG: hypothetical protein OEZ47_08305 [Gammaproteobacteria bacterium]|nr:hypothetical protein [Gammaproteobacteria bacterium]
MRSIIFLVLALFTEVAWSIDSTQCNPVPNPDGIGPWDYYDPKNREDDFRTSNIAGGNIHLVEKAHFTQKVENLISGESSYLYWDIEYTLRRIPNHPRALWAASRYERSDKYVPHPKGQPRYSAECYFDRAIRFQPDNAITHMLYAMHMQMGDRIKEAEGEYKLALDLDPNHPEIRYNVGLFYFKRKNYDKAYEHAVAAYDKGYPLPGLKNMLKGVKKWR